MSKPIFYVANNYYTYLVIDHVAIGRGGGATGYGSSIISRVSM